jgi:hypothetical protein
VSGQAGSDAQNLFEDTARDLQAEHEQDLSHSIFPPSNTSHRRRSVSS